MMKSKFDIKPSEKAKQFMRMCGVPGGLLAPVSLDLQQMLTPFNKSLREKEIQLVPINIQLGWFHKLRKEYKHPFLAIISSKDYYIQARQLTTILFWAHLQYSLNYTKQAVLPIWYAPSSDFKHNFMDDYKTGQHAANILLTIDNVYEDMPSIKLDKVRDMIQILCDRPRIIIYNGQNPFQFCVNKLGLKPTNILNLAKNNPHERRRL